jgi:hypothetical protein
MQDPIIAAKFDGLLNRQPAAAKQALDVDALEKRDPPMGIDLPESGAGKEIRKLAAKPKGGTLVLTLGDCGSCTSIKFPEWERAAKEHNLALLGVSTAKPADITKFRKEAAIKFPVVSDADGTVGRALNAYWAGRIYFFDTQWKLRWKTPGFGNPNGWENLPDLQTAVKEASHAH